MTNLFVGGEALLLRILSLRLVNDTSVSPTRVNIFKNSKVSVSLQYVSTSRIESLLNLLLLYTFVKYITSESDISAVNSDCIAAREYVLSWSWLNVAVWPSYKFFHIVFDSVPQIENVVQCKRFSLVFQCGKTETKVITTANQKKEKYPGEPMKTHSKNNQTA